jgi:FXSXX-COOH protein
VDSPPEPERVSRIADLTAVPLADLPTVVGVRVKKSLREVVEQVNAAYEVVAGFGSAI